MKTNDYDYIADLYDTYVPAAFDIPFFVDEARKSPGDVLELMSGTGRVSIPLLEAGIKLTCVDISAGLNAVLSDKLKRCSSDGRPRARPPGTVRPDHHPIQFICPHHFTG
jgi:SAM-dependent methyltransferase